MNYIVYNRLEISECQDGRFYNWEGIGSYYIYIEIELATERESDEAVR